MTTCTCIPRCHVIVIAILILGLFSFIIVQWNIWLLHITFTSCKNVFYRTITMEFLYLFTFVACLWAWFIPSMSCIRTLVRKGTLMPSQNLYNYLWNTYWPFTAVNFLMYKMSTNLTTALLFLLYNLYKFNKFLSCINPILNNVTANVHYLCDTFHYGQDLYCTFKKK